LPAKKLADELCRIVGVDTSDIDAKRAAAYEDRRDIGRDGNRAKAAFEAMPEAPDGTPDELVSAAAIVSELDAATAKQAQFDELALSAEDCGNSANESAQCAADIRAEIKLMEDRAAESDQKAKILRASATEQRKRADAIIVPDIAEIRERLAAVERTNANVAIKQSRGDAHAKVKEFKSNYDKLTKDIVVLDAERERMLVAADWPVDDLSISDGTVTLGGLPFDQASQAERLRVGVALALADKPDIGVVLVRDGSLLDDDSMALLANAVAERDGDLWIERVGTGDAGAIVIEDGRNKVTE